MTDTELRLKLNYCLTGQFYTVAYKNYRQIKKEITAEQKEKFKNEWEQCYEKYDEHSIQNKIRIWCGEHDYLAIRINVGSGYTRDGRIFSTGAPNGYPDLTILGKNGFCCYCETKTPVGRLRKDQKEFHAVLRERGFKVIVPHSFEEFVEEMEHNND